MRTNLFLLTLCLLLSTLPLSAQTDNNDAAVDDGITIMEPVREEPSQWVPTQEEKQEQTFFQGFSLAVDLVQPVMIGFSDFGGAQAALRLNLKNTVFPVVELGYTDGEKTDENTDISYAVSAPYFKAGFDLNMLRDKWGDNKLFVGLRYGFTSFNYDMSGPAVEDPVWGGTEPFGYEGIDCTVQTLELVAGVQVKIWSSFHMGWLVRYKRILSQTDNVYSEPYYIPGYGNTTGGCAWSFDYQLVFDLNWGKKRTQTTPNLPPTPEILIPETEPENEEEIKEETEEKIKEETEEEIEPEISPEDMPGEGGEEQEETEGETEPALTN